MENRGLPRAESVEMTLLGIYLRNPNVAKMSRLKPEHFYSERHKTIAEAVDSVRRIGCCIETVGEELRRTKRIELAGGDAYLMDLIDGAPSSAGWEAMEAIVRAKATRRKCVAMAQRLEAQAMEDEDEAEQLIGQFGAAVRDLVHGGSRRVKTHAQAVETILQSASDLGIVKCGIEWLDSLVKIRRGNLIVLAGKPGSGKSALAPQVAAGISRSMPVLVCSLEMSPEELTERVVAQQQGIKMSRIMGGKIDGRDRDEIMSRRNDFALTYCDCRTVDALRMEAMSLAAEGELGAVVVDYIQLMTVPKPSGSKAVDVGEISRGLKLLAMELRCPVIALSQLNREGEQGEPEVHNLKDSGSVGQDANVVAFIFADSDQQTWLKVAKNRSGPIGKVPIVLDRNFVRFASSGVAQWL